MALFMLCLLLPILLAVGLVQSCVLGGNPFFCQHRIGYRCQPFRLYKFRTMSNTRDAAGRLLPDSLRITRLGRWLRRTSIDELPQLWNVVKGQMSLIGPRPLPVDYAPILTAHPRHTVRPGLTGWAQIHGRNKLTWAEKFALDEWYVLHGSFLVDCLIIWRTLPVLVDTSPPAQTICTTSPYESVINP